MTEYAFFAEKVDRWGKDMASLWGNFNICPQLHQGGTSMPLSGGIVLHKQPQGLGGPTEALPQHGLFIGLG